MLHLIGLGLNEKNISIQALEALKKCKKVYLEEYTVEFPYKKEALEKVIGKKIIVANRDFVENQANEIAKESKKEEIAILVYGSPLTATTHASLLLELKKNKVKYQIIYSASVIDAVAESGLQLYKFGKTASMPKWQKSFKPQSFIDIVRENQSIKAHSLILADIGLKFEDALEELEISASGKINLDKIVVCSRLGTKDSKIFYGKVKDLMDKKILAPFCIIIPSELHFMEKEFLENYAS